MLRAHASATTACAFVERDDKVYVVSSGNDQWVRLWEVAVARPGDDTGEDTAVDAITVRRMGKTRTSIADVSDVAVLGQSADSTRVILCGVGMEVIRVSWG